MCWLLDSVYAKLNTHIPYTTWTQHITYIHINIQNYWGKLIFQCKKFYSTFDVQRVDGDTRKFYVFIS